MGGIAEVLSEAGVKTTFALDVQGKGKVLANRCSILEEDLESVGLKEMTIEPFSILCVRCYEKSYNGQNTVNE